MESFSSCTVWASMARTLPFILLLQVVFEVLNVEVIPGVGPCLLSAPAGSRRLRRERFGRVFVAMFGDNGLIRHERDLFSRDRHGLCHFADESHLDTVAFGNPPPLPAERIEIEIRS